MSNATLDSIKLIKKVKQIDNLNQSIKSDQKLLKEIDELSKIIECKSELFQLYDEVYNDISNINRSFKRTNKRT